MSFVVAIDGPAASGKGTVAKGIARHFGFSYLDTGLIYRAVANLALKGGNGILLDLEAIKAAKLFKADYLNLKYLRTSEAGTNASKIANIPEVRDELIKFQRNFSLNDNGSVLDGRDIGTVICPSADIKFFITASLSVRAKRRYEELIKEKNKVSLDEIVADLQSRDYRDSSRENSPLKISYDAHLIDTTELSIEAAIARAINLVNQKNPNFG